MTPFDLYKLAVAITKGKLVFDLFFLIFFQIGIIDKRI